MNIKYYTIKKIDNKSNITEYNYEKFHKAAKQYDKLVEFDIWDVHFIHKVVTDNSSIIFPIASY